MVRRMSERLRAMESDLRSALVRRLHELSFAFHHKTETGRLQAKVLRDVEQVEALVRMLLENVLQLTLMFTGAVIWTTAIAPPVAGAFAIIVPATWFIVRAFRGTIRKQNEKFRGEIENMSARVTESLHLIPVARAHGLEEHEGETGQRSAVARP